MVSPYDIHAAAVAAACLHLTGDVSVCLSDCNSRACVRNVPPCVALPSCLAAYVPDEIITSRAGTRVLVVNTDAEGRFSMADALCEAKDQVLASPAAVAASSSLWTVATLTGHVVNGERPTTH